MMSGVIPLQEAYSRSGTCSCLAPFSSMLSVSIESLTVENLHSNVRRPW